LLVRQRHGERSDTSKTDASASRAMVAVLERRTWRLAAIYA
jgi:hypothetical protein